MTLQGLCCLEDSDFWVWSCPKLLRMSVTSELISLGLSSFTTSMRVIPLFRIEF